MSSRDSFASPTPPPRRRTHRTGLALPRPSVSHSSPIGLIESSSPGPSRVNRNRNPAEPIDLTLDDSDDEPIVVSSRVAPARRTQVEPGAGAVTGTGADTTGMFHRRRQDRSRPNGSSTQRRDRRVGSEEAREHIQAADRALARAAERVRALVDDDFEDGGDPHNRRRDRGLQDLPRPALAERPERPAIGFGGAVQRRGGQQVRYLPAPRRELPRPSRQYRRLAFGIHSDGDDDDDDDDYIPPDEHDMDEGRHEALAAGVQRRAAAAAQPQPPIHPDRRVNVPMDNAAAPRRGLPSVIQERQDRLREIDGILFGGYDAEDLEGRPRMEGVAPIRGLGGGFGGLFGRLGRMLPRFHDGEDFAEAMGLRFDVGGAAAGPGPGRNAEQDLETKLSQIQCPKSPEPLKGFEASFDLEASVPIVIDAEDDSPPRDVYFECPMCLDPLRVSSGYRSAEDRVWVLRCGHMIDQKCLHKLATPTTPEQIKNVINWSGDLGYLPILGGDEPPPPAKKKRKTTKKSNGPVIHVWKCPVEGCRVLHTSQKKELNPGEEDLDGDGARWVQTEDGGAIAAFM